MTTDIFHEPGYLLHNKARLEHLASLELPIGCRTVLSLGSGIGCHIPFFLERGCKVTVTDGRLENVARMKADHPDWDVQLLDVEHFPIQFDWHEVIYCYGLLYHCQYPQSALSQICEMNPCLLLLETCVAKKGGEVDLRLEDKHDPRCSLTGAVTRLSRESIMDALRDSFEFVYVPFSQPDHVEFQTNWNLLEMGESRAIFIGSTEKLNNPLLTDKLPMIQTRYVDPA